MPDGRPTSSSKDSKPISEETLIRRTASVLTAEIDKQIVMMDIESGRYLGLDDIGSVIWQRLESPAPSANSSMAWSRITMPTGR